MKRWFPTALVAAVALITVAASVTLYNFKQGKYVVAGAKAYTGTPIRINPAHVRGSPGAPVTLEEFGDFQCPACKTTSGVIRAVEKDYGDRLRVIFWQFPLPMHAHGREAALAVEAGSLQGRFWEMHDSLYRNQDEWSPAQNVQPFFQKYAKELGLDLRRFETDMAGAQVRDRVEAEQKYGVGRKVENTPTIFVNNRVVSPPFTPERLHEAIDMAIEGGTKR